MSDHPRDHYHVTYRDVPTGAIRIYRTSLLRNPMKSATQQRQQVKRNVAGALGIAQSRIVSVVNCNAAPQIGRRA